MSDSSDIAPELVCQVRALLAHLYDYPFLQRHPFGPLLDPTGELDRVARGQKLRRLILGCIEALRPQSDQEAHAEAAGAHALLTFRFVDGVPLKQIAALRGLGARQTYRELDRAVEAVARLLADRLPTAPSDAEPAMADSPRDGSDPLRAAHAEVARLRQAVHTEALDLFDITQGAVRIVRPLWQRSGADLVIATGTPWPTVTGDRVMLRQALLNLLTCALEATAGSDLTISVGISGTQAHLDLTALPQVERHGSPPPARPGVSLAVCEALLAAQGGKLEAGEQQGRWRARAVLPRRERTTILVIDDARDLVALIQRYLAGHDVNVVGATDGAEALRLATTLAPRLITLDVMMPSEDGWEILQKLNALPAAAQTPVVICSVLRVEQLARSMGASGYLAKPVIQADLLRVLRHWLGPLPPAA